MLKLVTPDMTHLQDGSVLIPHRAAAAVKPLTHEGRRVRSSTLLSLAAISMGATAGVLFPSNKAKATEATMPQLPLSSEATENPYQAVARAEVTAKAIATIEENSAVAAENPDPTLSPAAKLEAAPTPEIAELPQEPTRVEVASFSTDNASESQAFSAVADIKQGNFTPTATAVEPDASATQKKHSKVVSAQLDAIGKNRKDLETATLASPSPDLQEATAASEVAPIETVEQPQLVAPAIPTEVARTPATLVDDGARGQAVTIPVPQPETAFAPEAQVAIPLPVVEETTEAESQTVEDQPAAEAVSEPELIATEATAEDADSEVSYKVQSGDTIDAIALRYGVSRSDLVRFNNLDNPHQIQIAQELKIPAARALRPNGDRYETMIPGFNVVAEEEKNRSVRAAERVPAIVADNRPSTVVPTETAVEAVEEEATTPDPEPSTVVNASPNPYIERLKADILRMREASEEQETAAEEDEDLVVADATTSPSFNPEWQSDRASSAVERTASSLRVYSVRVRDNRSDAAKRASAVAADTDADVQSTSTQVAVAPAPPTRYNPNTRPQTGIQVSPELPPLSPDRYLPEKPAQFNGYIWPAAGVMTSGYGRRWGRMHRGIDIAGPTGTPIVAAASGEVITAGWNSGGFGNFVEVRHADGSKTRYAHNSKILVRKGQWVEQGERISLMGSTGYSTGPHLHFEIHPSGSGARNPMAFLPSR